MSRLEFSVTPGYVVGAVLVGLVLVLLGLRTWWRSGTRETGRRPGVAVVEGLRVLLGATILFALAEPEWVTERTLETQPQIHVLVDDTGSMQTRDVVGEAPGSSEASLLSRAEAAAAALDVGAWRAELGARFDVTETALSAFGADGDDEAPGTDLAGPLAESLQRGDVRAVVLVSDGDWNSGDSPHEVALRYRVAGVPILSVRVGEPVPLPDLDVESIDLPAFATVGIPLEVPFTIRSALPRDVVARVTLRQGADVIEVRDEVLASMRTFAGRFAWTPEELGEADVSIEVDVQPGEVSATNNRSEARIEVRKESLRVLLVEARPRWEYRYLRNALVRDPGVEVSCYLTHPGLGARGGGPHYVDAFPPREELSQFDVVFVGDIGLGPEGLTEDECRAIAGIVEEQAAGLVLMPGFRGGLAELVDSPLGPLFPVDLDPQQPYGTALSSPASLRLTAAGRDNSLTRLLPTDEENDDLWRRLPGFQWHAAALRARLGTTTLAVADGPERVPLLVTKLSGTGKVLFMGSDGAWRWREGFEDRYHYRFWGQVIRWMAYQRNMNAGARMRLFHTPDRPRVRTSMVLSANAMDATGAPLSGATVEARIQAPSGRVARVAFSSVEGLGGEGEWGLYRASFQPTEAGDHQVLLSCAESGETLEAVLAVRGYDRERVGLPARVDVMDELARVTGGDAFDLDDIEGVAAALVALPDPQPVVARTRLWCHPLFGTLGILLMTALWIGRKAIGRV